MSDDRKEPREVNTAAEEITGQPSQRRRRLVKGALSAPVFLTLQNGAVFANTSNDALPLAIGETTTNPVCVFPDGTSGAEVGTKFDFGPMPGCLDAQPPVKIVDGADGLLSCELPGNNNFKGGYIVAGSSGASICP